MKIRVFLGRLSLRHRLDTLGVDWGAKWRLCNGKRRDKGQRQFHSPSTTCFTAGIDLQMPCRSILAELARISWSPNSTSFSAKRHTSVGIRFPYNMFSIVKFMHVQLSRGYAGMSHMLELALSQSILYRDSISEALFEHSLWTKT